MQAIHKRGTLLIPKTNAVLIETESSPYSQRHDQQVKIPNQDEIVQKRYTLLESEFNIGEIRKEPHLMMSDAGDDLTEDPQVDIISSCDFTGELTRKREIQSLNSSMVPLSRPLKTKASARKKKNPPNPQPSFQQHPAPFIFEKKDKQFLGVH
mmetsp:Transcript_39315/g.60062  ORF Transcript_39315/g.60062 Transcript_39315/m.60062 type:complete len:153 (-) Transcript_39315:178-636(-)